MTSTTPETQSPEAPPQQGPLVAKVQELLGITTDEAMFLVSEAYNLGEEWSDTLFDVVDHDLALTISDLVEIEQKKNPKDMMGDPEPEFEAKNTRKVSVGDTTNPDLQGTDARGRAQAMFVRLVVLLRIAYVQGLCEVINCLANDEQHPVPDMGRILQNLTEVSSLAQIYSAKVDTHFAQEILPVVQQQLTSGAETLIPPVPEAVVVPAAVVAPVALLPATAAATKPATAPPPSAAVVKQRSPELTPEQVARLNWSLAMIKP